MQTSTAVKLALPHSVHVIVPPHHPAIRKTR